MFKTVFGAATLFFVGAATVDAQILRIGPHGGVSVRVPFVSVDVSPWGGTRVRAPFTSVDTPDRYYMAPGGYGYASIPPGQAVPYRDFHSPYFRGYHRDYSHDVHPVPPLDRSSYDGIYATPFDGTPHYGVPLDERALDGTAVIEVGPIPETSYRPQLPEIYRPPAPRYDIPSFSEVFPGEEPLADSLAARERRLNGLQQNGTDPTRLATRLNDAAGRLESALSVREEGDVWAEYLRCAEIQDLASDLIASRSLAPVSASQARELLGNFEGVVANSSLTWVTRLSGFDDTRGALTNLVMVLDAETGTGEESFTAPRLKGPEAGAREFEGREFEGREFEGREFEGRENGSRGWADDDLVPLPDSEELPAPVPDALPDAAPEVEPQPVFRGEV